MSEQVRVDSVDQRSQVVVRLGGAVPQLESMTPRTVCVEWVLSADEGWHLSVRVSGRHVRRDGAIGVQVDEVCWFPDGVAPTYWVQRHSLPGDAVPDWLRDVVSRYTPPRPAMSVGGGA